MRVRATLSLLGIYNWDNSILDGLTLPDNFTADDLVVLKNNLLIETAEFEILYSEPAFLKLAITEWCNKRKSTWKWLKETQQYEYNPIWNADYDRYNTRLLDQSENEINDFTRNLKDAKSGDDTSKLSGSDKTSLSGDDKTSLSGDDTTLHSVYGFNQQSTAAPQSSDKVDYGRVETTDYGRVETTDYGRVETTDYGRQDKMTYNSDIDYTGTTKNVRDFDKHDNEQHHERTQGNYGTTTTQYMITEEQKLAQLNLIDFIIQDFKKRFCLLVY